MIPNNLATTIISWFLSNLTFILAMLLIVLIAACFLGRYIVFSRKMIFISLGVIVIEGILAVFVEMNLARFTNYVAPIVEEVPEVSAELFANSLMSLGTNFVAFSYAFVFYMLTYREKRFLRSLASVAGLYGYYMYMQTVIIYTYAYITGGDVDLFRQLNGLEDAPGQMTFLIVYQSVSLVITAGLILYLYFHFYRKKRFYIIRLRNRWYFIIWLLLFTTFVSIPFALDEFDTRYQALSMIFGAVLPILGILAPILVVMTAAEKSLRDRYDYQESYLKAELDYIEQYKENQTETRAFRHDIINNLSMLDMMMNEGKNEEAAQHLKELLGRISDLTPKYVTGDEMLDCIVSMKAERMESLSIPFTADGVVDGGLNMKPMDVCGIFANALDNAIEAAEKTLPDAHVSFNIKRTEQFFVIRIANSVKEKVNVEKLATVSSFTSKNDTDRHGFGLRNIKDTAAKYDGLVKCESSDNEFILSVMIPRN